MNKSRFWSLTSVGFAFILYLISGTLAPFTIAFIFAYLLHPVIVTNANKLKMPKQLVTIGIFTIFVSGLILVLVLLIPAIYHQIATFINKIPNYKTTLEAGVNSLMSNLYDVDPEIASRITNFLESFANTAFSLIAVAANNIWGYTLATINIFTIIALVPIILFYFLRDWEKIISTIQSILPIKARAKIKEIFTDINQLLSAYIRGQLNICLLLSAYYAIGLTLIGIDLALLLGITTGFMIIIPFVGLFISLFVTLVSCYFTYGMSLPMLYVLILYIVGYISESYFLTPKIIRDRNGLHPVWIIFAVFATGSVFGFVGIVFAIPIAGITKLLLGHLIDHYKSTNYYLE